MSVGAKSYREWEENKIWYEQLKAYVGDPNGKIHFNLDGIDDPVKAAAEHQNFRYWEDGHDDGYIQWELSLVNQTPGALERTTFYRNGKVEANPWAEKVDYDE